MLCSGAFMRVAAHTVGDDFSVFDDIARLSLRASLPKHPRSAVTSVPRLAWPSLTKAVLSTPKYQNSRNFRRTGPIPDGYAGNCHRSHCGPRDTVSALASHPRTTVSGCPLAPLNRSHQGNGARRCIRFRQIAQGTPCFGEILIGDMKFSQKHLGFRVFGLDPRDRHKALDAFRPVFHSAQSQRKQLQGQGADVLPTLFSSKRTARRGTVLFNITASGHHGCRGSDLATACSPQSPFPARRWNSDQTGYPWPPTGASTASRLFVHITRQISVFQLCAQCLARTGPILFLCLQTQKNILHFFVLWLDRKGLFSQLQRGIRVTIRPAFVS